MARPLRFLLAVELTLHGLAHALPGMRATDAAAGWVAGAPAEVMALTLTTTTTLWLIAMAGLIGGGLGSLGARPFQGAWWWLAAAGAGASLLLLLAFRPEHSAPGAVLDVTILAALWWLRSEHRDAALSAPRRRWMRVLEGAIASAFVVYVAVLVAARPWYMRWGSEEDELLAALPGDELVEGPVRYGIQHAVTIHAPVEAVWPWIVQLGQDRGGFYSYDWLERMFGTHIRNVDRIVPEWQRREAGDSVFATAEGYLGTSRRLGWRVALVDPGRALVLEKWGAFVLEPVDESTTRFIVRTRGGGETSYLDIAFAPLGMLVFEPAHFIMQRRMLLGVKELAEASIE